MTMRYATLKGLLGRMKRLASLTLAALEGKDGVKREGVFEPGEPSVSQ